MLAVGLKLGLLVGVVAVVAQALQRRDDARRRPPPPAPWPPLDVGQDQQPAPATEEFSLEASAEEVGEATRRTEHEAAILQRRLATAPTEVADRSEPTPPAPAPSVTDAPSVAPEPAPGDTTRTWVKPEDDACPASHPVKAKLRSKVFHLPGMVHYDRTNADRCYSDAAAAEADGFRQAKR
jgi:hypothetical protein